MRQRPRHGVTREALAAAASAPLIRFHHPAGEHGTARLQQLTGDLQAELIVPTERGQVRAGEPRPRGSIRHVEVFQMGSVRTSIIGRPRPLPGPTRRTAHYTLICDEPANSMYEYLGHDRIKFDDGDDSVFQLPVGRHGHALALQCPICGRTDQGVRPLRCPP